MTEIKEKSFPVMEIFGPTIQGEGSMCGKQTMFIRMGGCDYRCTMCDSLHAVIPERVKAGRTMMNATQIQGVLSGLLSDSRGGCEWITLSGGNPCMHRMDDVIDKLKLHGWKIAVETQGTIYQPWLNKCDLVTISPKGPGMGETTDWQVLDQFMSELMNGGAVPDLCIKVVIFNANDLAFAKEVKNFTRQWTSHPIYLSLGNSWPPGMDGEITPQMQIDNLLKNYDTIAHMLYQDLDLGDAIFLPQLHVLIWANKMGV